MFRLLECIRNLSVVFVWFEFGYDVSWFTMVSVHWVKVSWRNAILVIQMCNLTISLIRSSTSNG